MGEYKENLWNVFNLREKNNDPSGYILYCLKYDNDRLRAHRGSVISVLKSNGVRLERIDNKVGAIINHQLDESRKRRTMTLLEELSILNGALEYKMNGFGGFNNIKDLKNGILSVYIDCLNKRDLAKAYEIVRKLIPEISIDLGKACLQNKKIISQKDKKTLNELLSFSKRQVKMHNNLNGFTMFSV